MRIVYFDIDSLRPDHLGCYGYKRPTSPAIDSVAREGIRFENYYCSSSPCMPSRTTLASGRFGIRHGVLAHFGAGSNFRIEKNVYHGPKDSNQVFPRLLVAHGIKPVCFSNFPDRHNAYWFMCGWEEFHMINLKGGWETGEEVNAKVLPWLQANASKDNFYLHINYWDAHRPYKMDVSWAEKFRDFPVAQSWPDEAAIAEHQSVTGPFTCHGQFPQDKSPFPLMPGAINNRRDFETMLTAYDAAISYVDHYIKQVLDELKRQGVYDDTVIIISADHGDAFGEHGIYSDHVNADECIHRVPLIIKWPGVTPANAASKAFMTNVDYAPTLCDLLEIPAPEDWDGMSYKENVRGRAGADRDHLVWDTGLYVVQRAVRTKSHLYIRTYDAWQFNNRRDEELYAMAEDPFQARDCAEELPDIVEDCRKKMAMWKREQMARKNWVSDPLDDILVERGKARTA
jgi:arylsulfatase A-like enzyme